MSADHKYKPLPRGDHEITVRLCHDCDSWHADDDSLLFNEGQKDVWESQLTAAGAEAQQLRESAERWQANYESLIADYFPAKAGREVAEAENARLQAQLAQAVVALEAAQQDFLQVQATTMVDYDSVSMLGQDVFNDCYYAIRRVDLALARLRGTEAGASVQPPKP